VESILCGSAAKSLSKRIETNRISREKAAILQGIAYSNGCEMIIFAQRILSKKKEDQTTEQTTCPFSLILFEDFFIFNTIPGEDEPV
jgi:hypothetical protein